MLKEKQLKNKGKLVGPIIHCSPDLTRVRIMSNIIERGGKMENKVISILIVLLLISTILCGCGSNGLELRDSFLSYYKDEFINN